MNFSDREERLKTLLKDVFYPVRVSPLSKARILSKLLDQADAKIPLGRRKFDRELTIGMSMAALAALAMIVYGILSTPQSTITIQSAPAAPHSSSPNHSQSS
jgi:hypothetical protein